MGETASDGLSSRVWTRERARREGVSERRLTRGPEFVRVAPGRYLETCWADDLPSRCAAVLDAWPAAVLSHWTAMAVQGLPAPVRGGDLIHVVVPPGGTRPTSAGVVAHRARSVPAFVASGLRVTGVDRAWCDAAGLVGMRHPVRRGGGGRGGASRTGGVGAGRGRSGRGGPGWPADAVAADCGDLVATGDALLSRRPTVAQEVEVLLAGRPGWRGAVPAREALALLDARSESAMESRLRWVMSVGGLPAPAVQHEVRDGRGRFVARLDLAYPPARLAVEYDGDHHREPGQWRGDLRRRERLQALGWRVVVVTAPDLLHRPGEVVDRVRRALGSR